MTAKPAQIKGVELDTRILDKITAEMKPRARRIVRIYGNNIVASAMVRAPVITGNLMNTIGAESGMIADMTFRVQDGTEYGRRVELGFVGQDSLGRTYNQAAKPFLKPSVEQWRQKFLDAFKELFK